jgi:hypothetical protein
MLRDADGYVGYLYSVSTDEFNVLLENKGNSVVKVTHRSRDNCWGRNEKSEQPWFSS